MASFQSFLPTQSSSMSSLSFFFSNSSPSHSSSVFSSSSSLLSSSSHSSYCSAAAEIVPSGQFGMFPGQVMCDWNASGFMNWNTPSYGPPLLWVWMFYGNEKWKWRLEFWWSERNWYKYLKSELFSQSMHVKDWKA